jgi:Fibronectin type III domain
LTKKNNFFFEMSAYAALAAVSTKATEPYSQIVTVVPYYSYALVTVKNNGATNATFRFCNRSKLDNWADAPDFIVQAGKSKVITVTGLRQNIKYNIFLAKLDANNTPVPQMPASSVAAADSNWTIFTTPAIGLSVAAQTATQINVTWGLGLDTTTNFVVWYAPKDDVDANIFTSAKAVDVAPTGANSAGQLLVRMKGLRPNMPYYINIYVKSAAAGLASTYLPKNFVEPNHFFQDQLIVSGLIVESIGLNPNVAQAVGCSYVNMSWKGNATQTYRLIRRDRTKPLVSTTIDASTTVFTSTGDVLVDNKKTEDGNFTVIDYNLISNTVYEYVLQSYESDGTTLYDQASFKIKTLTTSLTLSAETLDSVVASWTQVYPTATYQLRYKVTGADDSTIVKIPTTGTLPSSPLSYTISNLVPGTSYDFYLYVVEKGTAVNGNNLVPLGMDVKPFMTVQNAAIAGVGILMIWYVFFRTPEKK